METLAELQNAILFLCVDADSLVLRAEERHRVAESVAATPQHTEEVRLLSAPWPVESPTNWLGRVNQDEDEGELVFIGLNARSSCCRRAGGTPRLTSMYPHERGDQTPVVLVSVPIPITPVPPVEVPVPV